MWKQATYVPVFTNGLCTGNGENLRTGTLLGSWNTYFTMLRTGNSCNSFEKTKSFPVGTFMFLS